MPRIRVLSPALSPGLFTTLVLLLLAWPAAAAPPPGALVLFDGSGLSQWTDADGKAAGWAVGNGSMEVGKGSIRTRRSFRDCRLHAEFQVPLMEGKTGQARGNSGVFLQDRYEVQILDTYGQAPADNLCGAIYKVATPKIDASSPPGVWQSFDITFRAARYDGDEVRQYPRMSVVHNGVLVHDNVEIKVPRTGMYPPYYRIPREGPVTLQDHGAPVRFRNIWIVEGTEQTATPAR